MTDMNPNGTNTEIERKYLIKMPDIEKLSKLSGFEPSDIEQIYLRNPNVSSERVRKRVYPDRTEYTHTLKIRIDKMSAHEDERRIDADEYAALLLRRDERRTPIHKTRICIPYCGHVCEIDVYPFWKKQAVLEIELEDKNTDIPFPPFAELIREVTGIHAYSNNALSLEIPPED